MLLHSYQRQFLDAMADGKKLSISAPYKHGKTMLSIRMLMCQAKLSGRPVWMYMADGRKFMVRLPGWGKKKPAEEEKP